MMQKQNRQAAAALEFVLVASLLFTIFLGMIEVGRALMVLGAISNAARSGARAGAVTTGSYTNVCSAVTTTLSQAQISISPCPATVAVNGVTVSSDSAFSSAATAGSTIAVTVSIPYQSVSWFPAGATFFLSSSQQLTETVVMRKES